MWDGYWHEVSNLLLQVDLCVNLRCVHQVSKAHLVNDGPLRAGDYRVADETTLLSAEAAGAFVVALEDEFWQVRAAAIGSMASLALESRTFRTKCLDSLVDMLSDEIEKVYVCLYVCA